jgi:hypothetical protein
LRRWRDSVRLMWSNHFNAHGSQLLIQWITIVGSISNQPLRSFQDKSSARVASTRVTSCGEALSMWMAIGRPEQSATAMTFVPLPRLVFPTARPLF